MTVSIPSCVACGATHTPLSLEGFCLVCIHQMALEASQEASAAERAVTDSAETEHTETDVATETTEPAASVATIGGVDRLALVRSTSFLLGLKMGMRLSIRLGAILTREALLLNTPRLVAWLERVCGIVVPDLPPLLRADHATPLPTYGQSPVAVPTERPMIVAPLPDRVFPGHQWATRYLERETGDVYYATHARMGPACHRDLWN